MIQFFPGFYYFSSRFESFFSGFNYFIKYWLSYLVVFILIYSNNSSVTVTDFSGILISLLLFYCSYDVLCFQNDNISVKYEKGKGIQRGIRNNRFSVFSPFRVSIFLSLIFSLYFILNFNDFLFSFVSLILLILSFILHNSIRPNLRVCSFFVLYFLKPLIVGGWLLVDGELLTLVSFSLAYACCYLPNYAKRKLENGKLKNFLIGIPSFFTSGIFLKIIFILPFLFYDFNFSYFILIQIMMTSFEVINRKLLVGRK